MDLSREILSAETRFLRKLEEYFLFVFPEKKLESHGLNHHRRVWAYAKELMLYPGTDPLSDAEILPGKMIIAAYMHDIGMSLDAGPRHGLHSRNLCENFLRDNNLPSAGFSDLLDAIENHDDKEYLTSQVNNPLLQILSVADDLDAIGYIGIYRYLEIYLLRGVKYEVLGDHIIKNVSGRYNNLANIYGDQPGFIARHQPRFEAIIEFFNSYSSQVAGYQFGSSNPSGWCGIAELIGDSVAKGTTLQELISLATSAVSDTIIKQYFNNLRRELISYNNES